MTPTEEVTESNAMVADFNEATTGGGQISPFPPITSEDLSTDVSAAEVPELTPDTSMDGFDAMLEDDGVSNQLEQKAQESKTTRDQSLDDLIKSALETPGETELTDRAYRRDVDPLERELNDINDQIRREKLSMRRRIESIQSRGGGLKIGAQAEIANIQRESLSRQADLSIIQMAAQGRYDSAKEIADRAVSVRLEKDRRKNEVLQFVYDENKELFTTDEQRAFEQKQLERNRRYEFQKNQAELVQNTKLDAIKMAQMNGAPVSVLSAIQGAKTAEEVLSLAGQWGSVDMLERQYKRQQIATSRTNQLLALATAGDKEAIKELGFDPTSQPEKLDATTRRKKEEEFDATTDILRMATEYKSLIDTRGFTNEIFGDGATLGQIDNLRGQMTAAYKDAKTLGTLDAGLLTLMDQILGEKPVSSIVGFGPEPGLLGNITGKRSDRISSSLQGLIDELSIQNARAAHLVGKDPWSNPLSLDLDENEQTNTITQTSTNPLGL